jgi:hypothetical protein
MFVGLIVVGTTGPAVAAARGAAETPRQHCRRVGNDDQLRPIPATLAPVAGRLFGIARNYAAKTTYYRCADHDLLLCNVGANLPCGKANQDTELRGANDWCRDNRNADMIPMAVTGHDTIYEWKCTDGVAKPARQIGKVDGRGFFLEYWKKVR